MKAQALAKLAVKRIGDPERNIVIERLRLAYVNGEIDAAEAGKFTRSGAVTQPYVAKVRGHYT